MIFQPGRAEVDFSINHQKELNKQLNEPVPPEGPPGLRLIFQPGIAL